MPTTNNIVDLTNPKMLEHLLDEYDNDETSRELYLNNLRYYLTEIAKDQANHLANPYKEKIANQNDVLRDCRRRIAKYQRQNTFLLIVAVLAMCAMIFLTWLFTG